MFPANYFTFSIISVHVCHSRHYFQTLSPHIYQERVLQYASVSNYPSFTPYYSSFSSIVPPFPSYPRHKFYYCKPLFSHSCLYFIHALFICKYHHKSYLFHFMYGSSNLVLTLSTFPRPELLYRSRGAHLSAGILYFRPYS